LVNRDPSNGESAISDSKRTGYSIVLTGEVSILY